MVCLRSKQPKSRWGALIRSCDRIYVIRSDNAKNADLVPTHGGSFDLTVCQRLARLSHSLSNSALRLFIHLWDLQLRDLSKGMYLSNRDLAAVTGLGKNCVREGLDQLYSRRAIVLRWGDNKTANRIYVCFWDGRIEELGGSKIDPPKLQQRGDVGPKSTHLRPENQGCLYASERPRLDSDSDNDSDNRSIPQDGQKKNDEKTARPPEEAAAELIYSCIKVGNCHFPAPGYLLRRRTTVRSIFEMTM